MQFTPGYSPEESFPEFGVALEGVELRTLAPGSSVQACTRHSNYRILLLDPQTGRALVEGGRFFVEPAEAAVIGSTGGGYALQTGRIEIGLRLVICADGRPVITSPVQSLHLKRETPALAPEQTGKRVH
jgi:hypothetical protein